MISCIIPFYNEGKNTLLIIDSFLKVPSISQIICVDDGSTDKTAEIISKKYPTVKLIQLNTNQGKSEAIADALPFVKSDTVLLFDADIKNIIPTEIQIAIDSFHNNKLDLLILQNKGANEFIDMIIRKSIFLSGKRILKKSDLINIFKTKPKNYQIEIAINAYMRKTNKKTAWIANSSYNPHKKQKLGYLKGIKEDIKMEISVIRYAGIVEYLTQMATFCKTKLPVSN